MITEQDIKEAQANSKLLFFFLDSNGKQAVLKHSDTGKGVWKLIGTSLSKHYYVVYMVKQESRAITIDSTISKEELKQLFEDTEKELLSK